MRPEILILKFLFQLLVLGLFASWAQNDYGNTLISISLFGISISYFIQALRLLFYKGIFKGWEKAFYFFENIFISGIFYSIAAKLNWIYFSSAILVFSSLLLVILYIILAVFSLIKKATVRLEKQINFVFIFSTIVASLAFIFRIQHWPFASILVVLFYVSIILLITLTLFSWNSTKNNPEGYLSFVIHFIKGQRSQVVFVFGILAILFVFGLLSKVGFDPKLYNNKLPPELVKLKNEQSPRADVYEENYFKFLESRGDLEEDK